MSVHTSTKAGPNGPALAACFLDIYALEPDYIRDLKKFVEILSFSDTLITPSLDMPRQPLSKTILSQLKARKLIEIPDKEGKKRIIAIVDYWTQVAMRSLHESLNEILKAIPADCTFNQNNFKTLLK